MTTKIAAPDKIEIPSSLVRVRGSRDVEPGEYFVIYEEGVTIGRWGYKQRARPFTLAYKANKGVGYSPVSCFKTAEAAAKEAAKRNAA